MFWCKFLVKFENINDNNNNDSNKGMGNLVWDSFEIIHACMHVDTHTLGMHGSKVVRLLWPISLHEG